MNTQKKVSVLNRFRSVVATLMGVRECVVLALVLFVAGCSSTGLDGSPAEINKTISKVADNPDLIPPIYWSQTRHWLQKIEIYGPKSSEKGQPMEGAFMAQVERSKQSEVMVASSIEGWVFFQTVWDGKSLTLSVKPGVPKHIDPAVVLSDMQVALWPDKILRTWYAKNPSMSFRYDEHQRTVYKHNHPWVSVRYSASPCATGCTFEITNHHFDYRLKVRNLAAQGS